MLKDEFSEQIIEVAPRIHINIERVQPAGRLDTLEDSETRDGAQTGVKKKENCLLTMIYSSYNYCTLCTMEVC
jgi:hypothetical protein